MGNKLFLVVLSLISLVNGFYYLESFENNNEESFILDEFKLVYQNSNEPNNKFPHAFTIDLSNSSNQGFNLIKFVRIDSSDIYYPITSSNFFINNANKNVEKINSYKLNDYNYEMYRQENGKGYATLIRDDKSDKSTSKYEMIGTIFSNKDNKAIYDIIPISFGNIELLRNKRDLHNHPSKSSYVMKKRPVVLNNHKFDYSNIAQYIKSNQTDKSESNRKKRLKSLSNIKPIHMFVELLVVVDESIYLDHQKLLNSNDSDLIFNNIRVYYSHFFNGVNLQYQNSFVNDPDLRISVKLKNFLIFMNYTEWTDSSKYGVPDKPMHRGREVLQAGLALDAFQKFMNSNTFPFTYDMAISVFNKDLWLNTESESASVVGFGFISSVCTQYKYIIMEDIGGFAYLTVASHEIGHNLGAYHDGSLHPKGYADCPTSNGNIMSSFLQIFDYRFSHCSIRAFKSHLLTSDLDSPSARAQCLINKPIRNETGENHLLNANEQCKTLFGNNPLYCNYPGQIWSADDQCKMTNGNESFYCNTESALICSSIWCGNKLDASCSPLGGSVAEGTTCDKGKICIKNKCVKSELGSSRECPFNDGLIFQTYFGEKFKLPYSPMTCESYLEFAYKNLIYDDNSGCLNTFVKGQCCNACQKYQDFKCVDKNIYCGIYNKYCFLNNIKLNDVSIKEACPRTCRNCPKIICKDNVYLCQNGGTCQNTSHNNSVIAYKCICPIGYHGFLCELKNPCLPNPCKNDGICHPIGSLGKYYCKCPSKCNTDFTCSTCINQKIDEEKTTPIHEYVLLIIFQLFYFFLILGLLLFLQRFLNWYCFIHKVAVEL